MTYPKGVTTADEDVVVFKTSDWNWNIDTGFPWNINSFYLMRFTSYETNLLASINPFFLKVNETGSYRIDVSGVLAVNKSPMLGICKNAEGNFVNAPYIATVGYHINSGQPFNYSSVIDLTAGDSICFVFRQINGAFSFFNGTNVQVTITKVKPNTIDFQGAFADFSTTDFLKEVVHRFGLTMFKENNSNVYSFLTLQEQLQSADIVDWSSKFSKKINENYIVGSYAQRNWFRYNYNDKEAAHCDFFVNVDNVNLPETRDVIKSKIYAPEVERTRIMGRPGNVYKLWDKEVVDNPEPGEAAVKYKSLDKRFYFLRAEKKTQLAFVKSIPLNEFQIAPYYYAESFWKMPFYDVISEYYQPLKQILNRAVMVNAELYLNPQDIANFDFRKLYYIEQLSGYYLMNKINNYVQGKPVKCELVRVQYSAEDIPPQEGITITSVAKFPDFDTYVIIFTIDNFALPEGVEMQFKASVNNAAWQQLAVAASPQNPFIIMAPHGFYTYWKIECPSLDMVSNVYEVQ